MLQAWKNSFWGDERQFTRHHYNNDQVTYMSLHTSHVITKNDVLKYDKCCEMIGDVIVEVVVVVVDITPFLTDIEDKLDGTR